MKILMTLMGLDIGGAETHVAELTEALCRRGHQVVVASNGGVYEPMLEEAGAVHVKIPMHRRSPGSMLRSLVLLRALISREQPDLVHAHARIPGFLCGILQKTMKFPLITTAHGVFQVTPLLRLMTNWGDRTVAVSQDIREYLRKQYQVSEDRIHMTVNAIDTKRFSPGPGEDSMARELGLGCGPVIGTVTRLDDQSSLAARNLIGAMAEIRRTFPNAQLLVVGGGTMEDRIRAEAERMNRALGDNAVVMTGPRTDIPALLRLSHVFVGVSRAALEAMACEKPVLLAGEQGYQGVLTEEAFALARESNFCCRGLGPIRQETMAADLLALLRLSETEKQALGGFGREMVERYYSVARMADDYLMAYEALLHPGPVIRAVVSGYYGYGNLGDDAILYAMDRQLAGMEPPVRLTVLSRNPGQTRKQYGLPAVRRFSPFGVYRALKNSDVLISGGGSLLQDKTSTRSLLYYLAVIRMAKGMKKPVFLYANGIGPLTQEKNRSRVKRVLGTCDGITLRDRGSLEELERLGLNRQDAAVTGDPVFALMPESGSPDLSGLGLPERGSYVGISVRPLPGNQNYIREFAALSDRLSRELGKTVVFLVMQTPGDEDISRQVRALMEEPSYLVKTPGEPETMLALMEKLDVVVSMRLHTLIFAAAAGVPMVGCVYDPKVEALLGTLGMPDCGTPETMEAGAAFATVKDMLEALPETKNRLVSCRETLAAGARENSRLFQKLMQTHEGEALCHLPQKRKKAP